MTPKQSNMRVGETSHQPKKLKFHRFSIKNILIIFLDSKGIVHKEIVPEGRTENTEFYKRVMDLLLMCIQLVRPAAF